MSSPVTHLGGPARGAGGRSVHLERLALVAEALTGRPDDDELLEIVIRQGMAAVDAEGGVVALVDEHGMVQPVLMVGYPADTVPGFGPLTLDRLLPITVAAREHVAVWVPDPADGLARFPALADATTASQAWAAIPLLDEGVAFGVISVTFTAPHEFTEPEQAYLQTLAHLAALALRRSGRRHPSQSTPRRRTAPRAPVEIAVLGHHGTIIEVNDAWIDYAARCGGDPRLTGVGASYLEACDRAANDSAAAQVGRAIPAALRGDLHSFDPVTIDCPFPTGEITAAILVSPRRTPNGEPAGATIVILATAP